MGTVKCPLGIILLYYFISFYSGEIKFNVYGTDAEKRQLLALLRQYSDVFSDDKLGRGAANVTPMKIDVDDAGWQEDKRS